MSHMLNLAEEKIEKLVGDITDDDDPNTQSELRSIFLYSALVTIALLASITVLALCQCY